MILAIMIIQIPDYYNNGNTNTSGIVWRPQADLDKNNSNDNDDDNDNDTNHDNTNNDDKHDNDKR